MGAFPAHVKNLILDLLDNFPHGFGIGWLEIGNEILRNGVQSSGRVADKKLVQRTSMQREALDEDVTIFSRLALSYLRKTVVRAIS